jgi:hypothetical protein
MYRLSDALIRSAEHPQRWAGTALLIALGIVAVPAIRKWGNAPANLQAEITQTRLMVARVIDGDPESGTSLGMMPLRDALQVQLENHLGALNSRISELTSKDGRLDQAITSADNHLGEITGTAEKLRADVNAELASLNATLAATAAPVQSLVKDGQDSWDDLYWDVKGTVASSTVAVTSIAQASQAVRDAAPAAAKAAVGIEQNIDGITADIHTATSDFVKPKTFWQKFKAWIEVAGKVAARFI